MHLAHHHNPTMQLTAEDAEAWNANDQQEERMESDIRLGKYNNKKFYKNIIDSLYVLHTLCEELKEVLRQTGVNAEKLLALCKEEHDFCHKGGACEEGENNVSNKGGEKHRNICSRQKVFSDEDVPFSRIKPALPKSSDIITNERVSSVPVSKKSTDTPPDQNPALLSILITKRPPEEQEVYLESVAINARNSHGGKNGGSGKKDHSKNETGKNSSGHHPYYFTSGPVSGGPSSSGSSGGGDGNRDNDDWGRIPKDVIPALAQEGDIKRDDKGDEEGDDKPENVEAVPQAHTATAVAGEESGPERIIQDAVSHELLMSSAPFKFHQLDDEAQSFQPQRHEERESETEWNRNAVVKDSVQPTLAVVHTADTTADTQWHIIIANGLTGLAVWMHDRTVVRFLLGPRVIELLRLVQPYRHLLAQLLGVAYYLDQDRDSVRQLYVLIIRITGCIFENVSALVEHVSALWSAAQSALLLFAGAQPSTAVTNDNTAQAQLFRISFMGHMRLFMMYLQLSSAFGDNSCIGFLLTTTLSSLRVVVGLTGVNRLLPGSGTDFARAPLCEILPRQQLSLGLEPTQIQQMPVVQSVNVQTVMFTVEAQRTSVETISVQVGNETTLLNFTPHNQRSVLEILRMLITRRTALRQTGNQTFPVVRCGTAFVFMPFPDAVLPLTLGTHRQGPFADGSVQEQETSPPPLDSTCMQAAGLISTSTTTLRRQRSERQKQGAGHENICQSSSIFSIPQVQTDREYRISFDIPLQTSPNSGSGSSFDIPDPNFGSDSNGQQDTSGASARPSTRGRPAPKAARDSRRNQECIAANKADNISKASRRPFGHSDRTVTSNLSAAYKSRSSVQHLDGDPGQTGQDTASKFSGPPNADIQPSNPTTFHSPWLPREWQASPRESWTEGLASAGDDTIPMGSHSAQGLENPDYDHEIPGRVFEPGDRNRQQNRRYQDSDVLGLRYRADENGVERWRLGVYAQCQEDRAAGGWSHGDTDGDPTRPVGAALGPGDPQHFLHYFEAEQSVPHLSSRDLPFPTPSEDDLQNASEGRANSDDPQAGSSSASPAQDTAPPSECPPSRVIIRDHVTFVKLCEEDEIRGIFLAALEERRRLMHLRLCRLCRRFWYRIVLMPCGHVTCCDCSFACTHCPFCGETIRRKQPINFGP